MIYRGRHLDPVQLWENYIDLPANFRDDGAEFSSLLMCPNPDHDARRPHFQLNLRRPLCHCFSNCGISGTYERAISIIEGCTEREARKIILKHCSVPNGDVRIEKRGRSRHAAGDAGSRNGNASKSVSLDFSTYIPAAGSEYLSGRGIDGRSIAVWSIGWDQADRRIVIPADDDRGIRRFLIKRAIKDRDWPKYLYWPEKEDCGWGKQDILFGACYLDQAVVGSHGLVLVEGSLDTILWHQRVYRNAVGILGSSISERQAAIIAKINPEKITLVFDKDVSGFHAIQSAHNLLFKYPLFVGLYPAGKSDPAELSGKEGRRVVDAAIPIVTFNLRLPRNLKLERRKVHSHR